MRGNARECIRARACLPGAPPLDLELRENFFSGTCLSHTCFMFVLLSDVFGSTCLFLVFLAPCVLTTRAPFMFVLLTPKIPRSVYFSECEILTALPK